MKDSPDAKPLMRWLLVRWLKGFLRGVRELWRSETIRQEITDELQFRDGAATDTNEIKHLINRVKQWQFDLAARN